MHRKITRVSAAAAGVAVLSAAAVTGAGVAGAAAATPQVARLAAWGTWSHAAAVPGAQLWAKRYNGPGNGLDQARSVTVSRSGDRVFVTGFSRGTGSGEDYATVAYSTATGARLWASRYNGPGNTWDDANSLAVSPTSGMVYVTGVIGAATESGDYATVAYSPATGARQWVSFYNGPNGSDVAHCVTVSPTRGTVFVTGDSFGTASGWDYATVAYQG